MDEVVLTLREGADPARVAEALTRAGLRNIKVLAEIGVITGEADPAQRAALAAVDGVAAHEESLPVQLPPPDSPLQ